jgi:hypothetical protein
MTEEKSEAGKRAPPLASCLARSRSGGTGPFPDAGNAWLGHHGHGGREPRLQHVKERRGAGPGTTALYHSFMGKQKKVKVRRRVMVG